MILLRICVIYKGELHKRQGFKTSYLGSFRGAEIYKTELSEKISRRRLSKCLAELRGLGISLIASGGDVVPSHLLLRFKITHIPPSRAKFSRIAEMALLFAERVNAPLSFFIRGGSFFRVSEIALELLSSTSEVAVSCVDFESVAEACLLSSGAVIRSRPKGAYVEISPAEPDAVLKYKDTVCGFSDFSLSLPRDFPFSLPGHDALVGALELSGVLGHNDTKLRIL